MPPVIARRQVAYDAGRGLLTVGARAVVVGCDAGDNDCLLRTYLGLVAEQRDVPLGTGVHLRRDDVAVLAELLDLDDVDLEARLRSILHLSGEEAADLHKRLLRHRVAAAAVGVGLLAGVPATAVVASADEAPASVPVTTNVEVPSSPDAIDRPVVVDAPEPIVLRPVLKVAATPPAPAAEPAPAAAVVEPPAEPAPPAVEPEVEIGYTVTYEQDPSFVPPEGVDIGSSLVIERDAG
jgi:hypothetical protein